jgi:F0F1-type ATP synthase delta subunit
MRIQHRNQGSDAISAVEDYFRAMVTDSAESAAQVPPPKFLSGSAGEQAMYLWQQLYAAGGDAALGRAEKEFDNFVWSVRGKELWKFMVQTPDAFIDRETKIFVLRDHLESLGCSKTFVDLMVELFNSDEINSLEQIRQDFFAINREHRREVDVELVTPASMDAETLEYYKASIALNYLKDGDNMIFSHSVDNNIKGGYRVTVKGVVHDLTHNAPREAFFASLQNAYAAEERRVVANANLALHNADPTPDVLKDFDQELFPGFPYDKQ